MRLDVPDVAVVVKGPEVHEDDGEDRVEVVVEPPSPRPLGGDGLGGVEGRAFQDVRLPRYLHLDDEPPAFLVDAVDVEDGRPVLVRAAPDLLVAGVHVRDGAFELAVEHRVQELDEARLVGRVGVERLLEGDVEE